MFDSLLRNERPTMISDSTKKRRRPGPSFCRPCFRQGATLVLIVVLLPALLAIAALAINLAHIESINTDIQVAADAAVRAASREYVLTGDKDLALVAAQQAASRNPVGSQVLPITAGDLEYGTSIRNSIGEPYDFVPTGSGNAVRLTTRTLASGSGTTISPLFPILGSSFSIRTERSAVSTQGTIDVCLVVDRSGSMAYAANEPAVYPPVPAAAPSTWQFGDPVPPNSRWLDLIAAVKTFNQEIDSTPQQELVCLSTYSDTTTTPVPLTDDFTQIIDALNAISMQFESGGTNIGDGMLEGAAAVSDESLGRPFATKVVVLMTDGNHNIGTHPNWAAGRLAEQGITLFTITFSDEAAQSRMKFAAETCGGKHFHAVTATQLSEAFKEIARSLPTLLTR